MKSAAIYARVSTESQSREGTSLITQKEGCEQYARQNGFTVVKAVQEDASGARLDRSGLDQVRDLAREGNISAVIVYDPDRLSRSLGHLMLLIEEFERERVELVFVNAPHENTPEGMMLLQMRGMFSQYEREKIRERSRRGKERRAREGHVFMSGLTPFGYSYIKGEGRLELIPAEAEWVKRIFDWYVNEGASLRAIASRLNDLGVPTKRGAKCWQPSTIASILTNTTFKGVWYYGQRESAVAKKRRFADGRKPKNEKSSYTNKSPEQWIAVPVPAIVSPELFDAVAPQMERKARNAKRNCKTDYLLRGLLVCTQCGRRLTGRRQPNSRGNMYTQYYCTGRYDNELKSKCKSPWMHSVKLDTRVWERIQELLTNEELMLEMLHNHEQLRTACNSFLQPAPSSSSISGSVLAGLA